MNRRLIELEPGTRYVLSNCDGPYTRGEDDPKDLPLDAEVFPLAEVSFRSAYASHALEEIGAALPRDSQKGATVGAVRLPKKSA